MRREEEGGVSLLAREAMQTVPRTGDPRGTRIILKTQVEEISVATLLPPTGLIGVEGETCPLRRT